MLDIFVKAWDKNNKILLKYFEKVPPNDYQIIVEQLIKRVLNPYFRDEQNKVDYPLSKGLDLSRLTVINDGDYSGTQIYIIPVCTYEPDINDYYTTHNFYGSCSVCDALEGIWSDYHLLTKKDSKAAAAKEFHKLALHILQRFKRLTGEDDDE